MTITHYETFSSKLENHNYFYVLNVQVLPLCKLINLILTLSLKINLLRPVVPKE